MTLMVWMALGGMMLMPIVVVLTAFHHWHHLGATGLEKNKRQDDEDCAENDVEHGGVVERNSCVDDCRMPFRRDPPERLEQRFDHECRRDHCKIEGDSEEHRHPAAV